MRPAAVGMLSGAVAAALLLAPARTVAVAASALVVPLLAGAIAALFATRRAARELEVDEAATIGARTGVFGGFVVAVPFPLALNLLLDPPRIGMLMTIGAAALVLVAFVALAIGGAVAGARIWRP